MTKMIGIRSFECNKHSRYRALDVLSFCSSFPYLTIKGYVMVLKATMDPKELFEVACESQPTFVQFTALDRSSQHADFHEGLFKICLANHHPWSWRYYAHNLIVHFTKRKSKKVLVTFIMTCLEVHLVLIRNSNFVLLAKLFTSWNVDLTKKKDISRCTQPKNKKKGVIVTT